MTPDQRYFFDTTGYLHLAGVLRGAELNAAQNAVRRYVDPAPHPVVLNLTPKAGDVVIISELLTHGVLIWRPRDRDRRFLMLRYMPQFVGPTDENLPFPFPDEILGRLSPETRELIEFAPRSRIKEIVQQDVVTLS